MKSKKSILVLLVVLLMQMLCVNAYGYERGQVIKRNVPLVLMYHRISDDYASDAFTITPELFENDIKELVDLGYKFCTADELYKAIKEYKTEKVVAITFDDGYKSDVEIAIPILKKYNACATFFIIGSKVGTDEYVTKEDIKTMHDSGVAQIGNHSYDYHEKPYEEVKELYSGFPDAILNDVKKNQDFLKEITGEDITAFSYPYGVYGHYIDYRLKDMGMVTFSSDETVINSVHAVYGRFNRPYDIPLDIIIDRVNTNNKNSVKLTSIQIANNLISNIKNN